MSDHACSASGCNCCCSSPLVRHHFLLRRLHSLSGIIPIGAFMAFHLFTNMQMMFGSFQHEVNFIHNQPALLFMEIGVLALPILFHGILGMAYVFTGKPNAGSYNYGRNWAYTFQRITGVLALIFIFLHVGILRLRWDLLGWYTPFFSKGITEAGVVTDLAHYSTSVALASPVVLGMYIVGVMSAVYHFANGLWTAAITWGLTISLAAQKRWGMMCCGIGCSLTLFMALALVGAVTYKDKAPESQKQAYAYMAEQYKKGQLDFQTLEHLSVTPTGTVLSGDKH